MMMSLGLIRMLIRWLARSSTGGVKGGADIGKLDKPTATRVGDYVRVTWTALTPTDYWTQGHYIIDRRQRAAGAPWSPYSSVTTAPGASGEFVDSRQRQEIGHISIRLERLLIALMLMVVRVPEQVSYLIPLMS